MSMSTSTDPIFFWRETETPYGFLCQWFPSPFQEDTITYPTAEHYMMYHKARIYSSDTAASAVLNTPSPAEAKYLLRSVSVHIHPERTKQWEAQKYTVVERGNMLKFTQNQNLGGKLLDTGDRELVEASPKDRVWGIGFPADVAEQNRGCWGMNLLGTALMSVREQLRLTGQTES